MTKMDNTPAEWRELAKQTRRAASEAFAAGLDGRGSDLLAQASDFDRIAAAITTAQDS